MTLRMRRTRGADVPHLPITDEQDGAADELPRVGSEGTAHDAVAELVRSHAVDVLAYLERRTDPETAADVMGETYVVVWRRAAQIPPDTTQARMWMFVTARNVLANHRRGERRAGDLVQRLREELVAAHRTGRGATSDVAGPREGDAVQEAVRDAIRALPPAQADVVMLVHWEGFSLVDAAQVIGVTASTARSRYAAARRELALRLGPELGPTGASQRTVLR